MCNMFRSLPKQKKTSKFEKVHRSRDFSIPSLECPWPFPMGHSKHVPMGLGSRFPAVAHVHAGEELPGAGAAERREDDQRAAQWAPGALGKTRSSLAGDGDAREVQTAMEKPCHGNAMVTWGLWQLCKPLFMWKI